MYNFNATAAPNYDLQPIPDCWIMIPGIDLPDNKIELYALPQITDSKQAIYSDQPIQGRSSPVKTYSNSSNRTISLTIHLYVTKLLDIERNLKIIRGISSLVHPEYENTYLPPRVARIKCGRLLSDDPEGINAVLRSYEVTYETETQWFYSSFDENNENSKETYMPLHVSLPTQWDVVYDWKKLPGFNDVLVGRY